MWELGTLTLSKWLPIVMVVCLVLTIVIEILAGLLLKVRGFKNIAHIALVNVMTNPLLVSVTHYTGLLNEDYVKYIVLAVLEILAVIAEGVVYKKYLKYDNLNPFVLSLFLNICSFGLVSILNMFIY